MVCYKKLSILFLPLILIISYNGIYDIKTHKNLYKLLASLSAVVILSHAIVIPESFTEMFGRTPVTHNVQITDGTFVPAQLYVRTGDTVLWTNTDTRPHTVTSYAGLFDSKDIQKNTEFKQTYTALGVYNYHCTHHPYMKGSVVVSNLMD